MTVTTKPDANHNPVTKTVNVTVNKVDSTLTVSNVVLDYGETINVNVSAGGALGISAKIGDSDVVVDGFNVTIPVLDAGNYTLTVTTKPDGNHNPVTKTVNVVVNKVDSTLTVDNVSVDYGETKDVTVSAAGVLGISAKIEDIGAVVDGYTIIIPVLDAGNYTLTVTTIPDDNHNSVEKTANIIVHKVDSTLSVESIIFDYNSTGSAVVSFTGSNGVVALVVNQPDAVVDVKDNTITLSNLNAGNYTLAVTTIADGNHNPVRKTANVTVNKVDSTLTVSNVVLDYGETTNVTVATEGASGITAKIDDGDAVVNDYAIVIPVLDAGNYTLTVTTIPDDNHNPVTQTAGITVNKVGSKVNIEPIDNVTYGNALSVKYSIENRTDNVSVIVRTIDGTQISADNIIVGDDVVTIVALDVGNYTISIINNGDRNIMSDESSGLFKVVKFSPHLALKVSDISYGEVEVITVTSDVSGSVNITVCNITQTLELNDEEKEILLASLFDVLKLDDYSATLSLNNLGVGKYPVSVVFNGNENFESVGISDEFEVNFIKANMKVKARNVAVGDVETITVTLPDNAEGHVIITVSGKTIEESVKNGKAIFKLYNLKAGAYEVSVLYSGDEKYLPANGTANFEISKVKPYVAIEDTRITDGKIAITLPGDATGSVTIEIEGRSYTAPVKDGRAVFYVPGLSDGKHDIKVYYSGDEKYGDVEFDDVITVESNSTEKSKQTDNHENPTKSIKYAETDVSSNATGNPIFVLLLALLSIGAVALKRFKP